MSNGNRFPLVVCFYAKRWLPHENFPWLVGNPKSHTRLDSISGETSAGRFPQQAQLKEEQSKVEDLRSALEAKEAEFNKAMGWDTSNWLRDLGIPEKYSYVHGIIGSRPLIMLSMGYLGYTLYINFPYPDKPWWIHVLFCCFFCGPRSDWRGAK